MTQSVVGAPDAGGLNVTTPVVNVTAGGGFGVQTMHWPAEVGVGVNVVHDTVPELAAGVLGVVL